MRIRFTAAVLLAGLALLAASPSRAQQVYTPAYPYAYPGMAAPWAEAWAGFGGQNNWYGGYAGGNYALNHNVWADGFLLRADGYGGHYDYPTPFVAGGRSNVTYGGGDFMLGYRKVIPGVGLTTTVTGYVGADFQDHNNPDPTADVRGSEWGVKVIGEVYSRLSQYQDFYGQGAFSSAFDTWLLIARPGFLVNTPQSSVQFWVGPEGIVDGNGHGWLQNASSCPLNGTAGGLGSCKFAEGKIGGFLHIVVPSQPLFGDWLISGGYRKPLLVNGGPDGYYAQIALYFRFQ